MKPDRPQPKQPRDEDVQNTILEFIERHFYQGQPIAFAKDRPKLLEWVVWKLAIYLDERAVWIPNQRYIEIMLSGVTRRGVSKPGILMEALRFGDTGKINYLPAYLGHCVDSHLTIHGEDYYDEGKHIREHLPSVLKHAQAGVGQSRQPGREMVEAFRLLKAKKRAKKTVSKPAKNSQLTMF